MSQPRLSAVQIAIASWGVFGVLALLGQAMWRLTPLALEPLQQGMMTGFQWALYISWAVFNAYAEGYRGFQRSFSPRVVARAIHLSHHPKALHVALAPLFCMGLFHAKRRRLIASWVLTGVIILLIIVIRQIPQPWRGIVDVGVVVGLAWGALSIIALFVRALGGNVPENDSLPIHDLPPTEASA
jgi:hypothetical protein